MRDNYSLLINGLIDILEPIKESLSKEHVWNAYVYVYNHQRENKDLLNWMECLEQLSEFILPDGTLDIHYLLNEVYYMNKD